MSKSKNPTTVSVESSQWNGCSVDTRIVDRKTRNLARRLVVEMVKATDNQNKIAKRLRVNSGIVSWFIKETDPIIDPKEIERLRWTHITLTPLLVERIMLAHAFVVEGVQLSDELEQHVEHALDLESELSHELRWIRKAIKRL